MQCIVYIVYVFFIQIAQKPKIIILKYFLSFLVVFSIKYISSKIIFSNFYYSY